MSSPFPIAAALVLAVVSSAAALSEYFCERGQLVWSSQGNLDGSIGNYGVVLTNDDEGVLVAATGVSLSSGLTLWTRTAEDANLLMNPSCYLPFNSEGHLVGVRSGSDPLVLETLDIATGLTVWETIVLEATPYPSVFCREDRRFILVTSGEFVSAITKADGRILWTAQMPENSYPVFTSKTVVVFSTGNSIVARDAATGDVLWDRVSSGSFAAPTTYGKLLLLSHESNLTRLDVETGDELWQIDGRLAAFPPRGEYAPLFIKRMDDVTIARIDGRNGDEMWSASFPESSSSYMEESRDLAVVQRVEDFGDVDPEIITRMDALTGEVRLALELGPNSTVPSLDAFVIAESEQIYLTYNNVVERLTYDGQVRWRYEEEGVTLRPEGSVVSRFILRGADDRQVLYSYSTEGYQFSDQGLISLDRGTGKKLWSITKDDVPESFDLSIFQITSLTIVGDLVVAGVGLFEKAVLGIQLTCPQP